MTTQLRVKFSFQMHLWLPRDAKLRNLARISMFALVFDKFVIEAAR